MPRRRCSRCWGFTSSPARRCPGRTNPCNRKDRSWVAAPVPRPGTGFRVAQEPRLNASSDLVSQGAVGLEMLHNPNLPDCAMLEDQPDLLGLHLFDHLGLLQL